MPVQTRAAISPLIRPRESHALGRRIPRATPPPPGGGPLPKRRGLTAGYGGFAAASGGALYGDFQGNWSEINAYLRVQLPFMRARSRQLCMNNEYGQAWMRALLNNVLGSDGIKFDSQVRNPVLVKNDPATGKAVKTGGDLDVFANKIIEDARKKFERKECYTVRRRTTRRDAQKLFLACLSMDGELFVRKIKGFGNGFKFATQIIPPELIDINYNTTLDNGNRVVMGIEEDEWGAPLHYYLLQGGATSYVTQDTIILQQGYQKRVAVPEDEIIHVFKEDYPNQKRGIPWLAAGMQKLHQLGAYEEAAIINARVGATKMGFFKKTTPDGFAAEVEGLTREEIAEKYPDYRMNEGALIDSPMPGEWQELPMNVEPVNWSPNYPEAQFDPFVKAALRGVAAAVGTSYMTLSNDLSEANFSSLRAGLTEEREQWKMLQRFWIENYCEPEYGDWLYMALGNGNLTPLRIGDYDRYNVPLFTGRRWAYVQPLVDAQADALRLQMKQTSHQRIAREGGEVFTEIVQEIADDDSMLKEAGLTAAEGSAMGAQTAGTPPQPVNDLEGDGSGVEK